MRIIGGRCSISGRVSSLRFAVSIGLLDRFVLVELGEHKLDDVGPVEAFAETRGGEEVGRLVPAAVELPADQILAAGRGHVVAGRRPGDPGLGLAVDEQRQQLLAVRPAMPADRAVVIGRDDDAAVRREIDAIGDARDGLLPELPAVGIEGAQAIVSAEDETCSVRADGERT